MRWHSEPGEFSLMPKPGSTARAEEPGTALLRPFLAVQVQVGKSPLPIVAFKVCTHGPY